LQAACDAGEDRRMGTPPLADPRLDVPAGTALDFEIAWRDGRLRHALRIAGARDWQVLDAPALWHNRRRAPDAAVHGLSLRLRSRGWFSRNPDGHCALALRAAVTLPPERPAPGSLEGLGLAIGNVSGAPGGCTHPPAAQVESFWFGGNRLLPEAAGPTLVEDRWYGFELRVDPRARIDCTIVDPADGAPLATFSHHDSDAGRRPADLAGWFLTAAFAEGSRGDWALDVADFREDWRPD
jgi:hypothetical protein